MKVLPRTEAGPVSGTWLETSSGGPRIVARGRSPEALGLGRRLVARGDRAEPSRLRRGFPAFAAAFLNFREGPGSNLRPSRLKFRIAPLLPSEWRDSALSFFPATASNPIDLPPGSSLAIM
jgi:hypothetical protein